MFRSFKNFKIAGVILILLCCFSQGVQAQAPSAAFDVNDTITCVGTNLSFTDMSIPGGAAITNWNWTFGDGGSSTAQNPTYAYPLGGNYTVTLIVTDANGLKDTATQAVYVLIAQAINNVVRICSPQTSTTIMAIDPNIAGVTGFWFTSSSGVISSPSNDTTLISNLISGTYLFFWVVSDGTCSDADQVTVIVDQPVVVNAGPDQNICSTPGTATMAGSNPAPGTGLWTTTSSATISNPVNRNTTITGLTTPGTYVFVWTVTNGACVNRDTMNIIVTSPVASAAGADQLVCASPGTAVLAGSNPSPGTGLWTTTSSATITNPTSPTASVSGLTTAGVYTFIWTVTNGACINRDTMLITVSALIVSNAGNNQQICTTTASGTLSGNNPSPGTGVWTALNGGTITNPNTNVTTVTGLNIAGFYNFVWTITNGPCVSRDTVLFIVRNPVIANAGSDQTFCNATTATLTGNSPAPGTGAWTTTGGATIASPSSATTNVSGLAVGMNTFIYTTTYGACVSRDTVIIRVDALIISNAGPDIQICETQTSVTMAGNNPAPGTGVWTQLSGGTITTPTSPTTTITGLTPGNYSFVWTITNGTCVTRDTVEITVDVEIPSNAGIDQQICIGDVAFMMANDPTPATGLWTTTSSGIFSDPSDPNTLVIALVDLGANDFVWTISNGACVSSDTVVIIVDDIVAPDAGPDQDLCNVTTSTLSGNAAAPGTGQWTSPTGATITTDTDPNSGVTGLVVGTNTFVWTITNGVCVYSDTVDIFVSSLVVSNAGPDQQICGSSTTATLSGSSPAPSSGLWTTSSTATINNPTNPSTTVSGLNTPGIYDFIWTVTNGACESSDTISITVDQDVIADAGPDIQICETQTSVTMAGNNPAPGTGVWTQLSGGTITTPTSPTTTITGLTPGNYSFVWTITNGTCVTRDTVEITVDVEIPSNAGIDQQICIGDVAFMMANDPTPATGLWSTTSSGIFSDPSDPNTLVIALVDLGANDFVWTISNGACVSSDTVVIIVDDIVSPDAGPDQDLCNVTTSTLSGNAAAPGTGQWTSPTGATITTDTDPNSGVTGLVVGTNTFVWTITNGVCVYSDTVDIFVSSLVVSNAGPDQQICGSSTTATLSGSSPAPGSGLWTTSSTATINNPTNPSSTVSGLSTPGIYDFIWTVTNGACESSDTISITVEENVMANAGPDQNLCNVITATLSGNAAAPGTGLWTSPTGGIIIANSNPNSGVTGLVNGTNTFVWTITNGSCVTSDTVNIIVDSLIISNAGPDQQICFGNTITLSGNSAGSGTGTWTAINGGTFSNTNSPNTTVSGLASAGIYSFVWTITNGSCVSQDTIVITLNEDVVVDAGADQSLCDVTSTSLNGNTPSTGVGTWSTSSTATIVSPSSPTSVVNGLAAGTYSFVWTIVNGACTTRDTVEIIVDSLIVADAGIDQSVCFGDIAFLAGNTPSLGIGEWTTTSSAIIADPNDPNTLIIGLISFGNFEMVWTITNGGCVSSDTMNIQVDTAQIADAGPDQYLCETFVGTLNAVTSSSGTGSWTSLGAATVASPTDENSAVSNLVFGPNEFLWTFNNGACASQDTVVIFVDSLIQANAGVDQQACASSSLVLSANSPASGAGTWTSLGAIVVDDPANPNSTISNLQVGVNSFVWSISNGGCISNDTVEITISSLPTVDAGVDQFVTTGTLVTLGGAPTASGGVAPYTYVWNPGVDLSDSLVANPTLTAAITTTYLVTVTDSLGCSNTATTTVWVNDPPVAIDDSISTGEDTSVVVFILNNDSDPNNNLDTNSIGILQGPFSGSVVIGPGGQIIYTPDPNFNGLDSILYLICDDGVPVFCDSAWIVITVNPVNDAPVAVDDYATTVEDSCIQIAILANDTDVENMIDLNTLIILSGPSNGTYSLDPLTGILTYCPDSNFNGIDTLVYAICDSGYPTPILCDTALVIITTTGVNDPPITQIDTAIVCGGDVVIADVRINDIDPEGDSLTVSVFSQGSQGLASVDANQNIVYAANFSAGGWDSLQYVVCDQQTPAACDTSWLYIYIHPLPQVTSVVTPVLCGGDSTGAIDISLSPVGTYSFTWSNGSTDEDVDSLTIGIYTVAILDSNGCTLIYLDTVPGPQLPLSGTLTSQDVLCFGNDNGTIDIQISGGTAPYSYSWSNGSTDEDLDSLAAGVYTVIVTDSNACVFTLTDTIIAPSAPLNLVLTSTDVNCAGDSTGAIIASVSGGTPGYTYNWSNGGSTDSLNAIQAGVYTVIVTDSNACTVSMTDTIFELNTPIILNATVVDPNCAVGAFGNIQISVSGGVMPYGYLWNTGDTTANLDSLPAGFYQLLITDSVGCNAVGGYTLVDTASVSISLSGSSVFCEMDSVVLSVTPVNGYTYQWMLDGSVLPNDTNPQLVATLAGDYSITVSAGCGTFTDGPITITVNPLPSVDAGSDETVSCNAELTLNATGAINYSWSPANLCITPNQSSTLVNTNDNRTYTVIGTDANGCSAMDSVVVETDCYVIDPPTGFSPNNDGINDFYEISNMEKYPYAILKIFNRWGALVYEKKNYDNSWDGLSNIGSIKIGEELPNGTYYYVLDLNNDTKALNGFVVIRR